MADTVNYRVLYDTLPGTADNPYVKGDIVSGDKIASDAAGLEYLTRIGAVETTVEVESIHTSVVLNDAIASAVEKATADKDAEIVALNARIADLETSAAKKSAKATKDDVA